MKTYRETLDALRFTPQQKAAIAEDLLAAAQAGQVRAPRRKWGRVAAAAILAAALCAACASGALQEALSVLASQFGSDPKQQEVIGDLTRPSAASATDNDIRAALAELVEEALEGSPFLEGGGSVQVSGSEEEGFQAALELDGEGAAQ